MKKILFKKLRLLNFCGIRELEVNFGEDLTTISGRNGIGKTSILNAITYTLFGTDGKGNALDIKTFDRDHNIIPEISHESELTIDVDGEEVILKRTLSDTWKGDKCTNYYKYYVNDEVCTASDFKKSVYEICPEEIFRLCSSATDFVSRPWQDQRRFLQQLVPEITTDDITQGDGKYDFVLDALKREDIETVIKHIRYRRGEVQKQLDAIPIRMKELDKALPEVEAWESLEVDITEAQSRLDGINAQIATIKTGGAAQVRNDGIRKQLEFQRNRIDQMEKGARKMAGEEEVKHNSDLISARVALSKAEAMIEELKGKMREYTDTELHVKEQLEGLAERNKKGAQSYDSISSEKWQWDDNESFCPHCGQPYPIEKLLEIKRKSETNFNKHKADQLKELMQTAADIKSERTKCEELLEQLEKDRTSTTNQLTEAHKAVKQAETHRAEVEQELPREYTAILAENENYAQACAEAKRLEDELSKPMEDNEESRQMTAQLEEQAKSLSEGIGILRNRLAKKESFDHITSLIEECRKNKETYQNQLDEMDERLDIASDYYQRTCSLLEDEVNKQFQYVQWTLFKAKLDGERTPFCECYHDGVPYSRLNGAAKVNAGIDIAYTIARYYNVSVPMILDECESNLSPIAKDGYQQIRLYVSHDERLKIETGAIE